MLVKCVCPICGKTHRVTVDMDGYAEWTMGTKHIQDALPRLSATEREQLLSGTCPTCQKFLFGEE